MKTKESEVKRLYKALLRGIKVDRSYAFRVLNIADIRSRICDVKNDYGVKVDKEPVPNKRYIRYFFKSLV